MKIVFTTDPHLNFVQYTSDIEKYKNEIIKEKPDLILVGGDMSDGSTLAKELKFFEKSNLGCQSYFVCGNHDYYHNNIQDVRSYLYSSYGTPHKEHNKNTKQNNPIWLGSRNFISLDETTALVGHDGWYDAIEGDPNNTTVILADFLYVENFSTSFKTNRAELPDKFRALAADSAKCVSRGIEQSYNEGHKTIFVLTHVPPFRENSKYNNQISNKDFLPFFCSRLMGDALVVAANKIPDANITVLCGHTHHDAYTNPVPNLKVITGHSEYRFPCVSGLLSNENKTKKWTYKQINTSSNQPKSTIPLE